MYLKLLITFHVIYLSKANHYFNHPDFVHKKEKSINKKKNQILKAVSNHNPGKRKNKASQVINPLFFSGRDAGGRSFLHFHLFLVRDAGVVGAGGVRAGISLITE